MVCEVVTVEITLGLVMTRLPSEFVETTGTTGLISSPVVPPVKPKADTEMKKVTFLLSKGTYKETRGNGKLRLS